MIDAYVDGRPIPSSSSVFTSDASENRGGGWVKCCSGRTSSMRSTCSTVSSGKRRLGVGIDLVVAPFLIDADEPVEHERLARGAKSVSDIAGRVPGERLDVDPHLVEAGVGDLRRDGPLPDQAIQPQLVVIEDPAHQLRRSEHGRRTDGLVRLLRAPRLGLVSPRLVERVGLSVRGLHQFGDLAERRIGDVQRVGPHIGDQPDRSLAREVDAFVETLGERHGLARREPELARRLLLQGRRGERWGRRALALLALHVRDAVAGAVQALDVLGGVGLGAQMHALLVG